MDRLLYAISQDKGCALLTGEYGCGKTILIRAMVDQLGLSGSEVALISYPIFNKDNFLREILHEFGRDGAESSRMDSFREISQFFYENVSQKKQNVIIIDEAQLIDAREVFEELRLLLNIQLQDRFLVNVLLVGQPELREKIMAYPQLEQRVAVRFHLHRFDHSDTIQYVNHRLKVAGSRKTIFSEEALYVIYKISYGVPRRINNLCDLCLLHGAEKKIDMITGEVIKYLL